MGGEIPGDFDYNKDLVGTCTLAGIMPEPLNQLGNKVVFVSNGDGTWNNEEHSLELYYDGVTSRWKVQKIQEYFNILFCSKLDPNSGDPMLGGYLGDYEDVAESQFCLTMREKKERKNGALAGILNSNSRGKK